MSKVHGARCDQCRQHCIPGDGKTWITISDGPIKVTRFIKDERRSNRAYGRLDFCSIECLVSYIEDLQSKIPPASHMLDIVQHQTIINAPISKFIGENTNGKEKA